MGFERVLTALGHLILVFSYALPSVLPIGRARAEPFDVVLTCFPSLAVIRVRRTRSLPNSDAATDHHNHEESQGESLD
jgi:hypothetical protein